MKLRILLDLDEFDRKIMEMSEEDKKMWVRELSFLDDLSKRLLEKGEISKITYNRIRSIWHFSPYQNVNLMPTKRFNELFGLRNPNLRFIGDAVQEVLSKQELLGENRE